MAVMGCKEAFAAARAVKHSETRFVFDDSCTTGGEDYEHCYFSRMIPKQCFRKSVGDKFRRYIS
jgi:hypothetical protein